MIISGNHELTALHLHDIEADAKRGNLDEMKAVFVESVTNAIDAVTGDPRVTDAVALVVVRDEHNQIDVQRVELMRTSPETPDLRQVSTDHLRYQFEEKEAWKFYTDFCEMTEVLFNQEEQTPTTHQFSIGDINNNYFIEKE